MFIGILLALVWDFLQQALVNFSTVHGMPPLLSNLLSATILALAACLHSTSASEPSHHQLALK